MRLILDPAVRVYGGGRVLAARGRVIRLSPAGPAALRALLADTATPVQARLGERLIDAGFAHARPAPSSTPVTLVIPVKDDAAGLARCLAALGRGAPASPPAASPPAAPSPRRAATHRVAARRLAARRAVARRAATHRLAPRRLAARRAAARRVTASPRRRVVARSLVAGHRRR